MQITIKTKTILTLIRIQPRLQPSNPVTFSIKIQIKLNLI